MNYVLVHMIIFTTYLPKWLFHNLSFSRFGIDLSESSPSQISLVLYYNTYFVQVWCSQWCLGVWTFGKSLQRQPVHITSSVYQRRRRNIPNSTGRRPRTGTQVWQFIPKIFFCLNKSFALKLEIDWKIKLKVRQINQINNLIWTEEFHFIVVTMNYLKVLIHFESILIRMNVVLYLKLVQES